MNDTVKICMSGACGRMGRRILDLASQAEGLAVGGAFDRPELAGTEISLTGADGKPETVVAAGNAAEALTGSDAMIDFTLADACLANVRAAAEAGVPTVVGTTGLGADDVAALKELAQRIPLVYAPNMSVGVNLLFQLTAQVAKILGQDYNVEIVEAHHNRKQDSPSGTAVRLAEKAAEALGLSCEGDVRHGREGHVGARPAGEIGVHAVRGGDVVGEHTVFFLGQGERIELTHRAHSRDTFAQGALRAARFAATAKPGLYDMPAILGLEK